MNRYIYALADYAIETKLIEPEDRIWAVNRLGQLLKVADLTEPEEKLQLPLHEILEKLTDFAVSHSLIDDHQVARDLFDTELMGELMPLPHEVRKTFRSLYAEDPKKATDWYYDLSRNSNYIRRDRIAKDVKWLYHSEYGPLEITINLSKPEKDPRAIAAAKNAPQSGYPKCLLCCQNEGYAGGLNHPARQNHRIIPLRINDSDWFLQYSPYVYYNEHCIAFNALHTPMKIDRAAFCKLLDFVAQFPHYFVGSNADLPIVGGSILSHDHFQGGRHSFPMAEAPVETGFTFRGYEAVEAGIVRWPMSVIRLRSEDRGQLTDLADKILLTWRGYTDEAACIYAETEGIPHNTITPIARMRDGKFELDLVLRNNLTTEEHPLGLYHPHEELHHIKKENIGLIEVMGLAVLPARLKTELQLLETAILKDQSLLRQEPLTKHALWVEELMKKHSFNPENTLEILRQEVGAVFCKVLQDAGVYKRNAQGQAAFLRFLDYTNR